MTRVTVVGGGISGLAAAWEAMRSGADVTVLEASDRLGGKILTADMGGRPVDLGPDAFVDRTPHALQLCRELGLEDELVSSATDQAAIWVRGRLRPLPHDVVLGVPSRLASVTRSRILSPVGVARAALDVVLPRRADDGDRSVGDLVAARLGRQVHDRLVDPLFGGIHAGPSKSLSVQATAPQLAAAAAGRSLMRGVRSQRRDGGQHPSFHSLRGGLGRLVERLEEELRAGGAVIEVGAAVESLPMEAADVTVLATPAPVTADLVAAGSLEAEAELRAIDHGSVILTVLTYPASALPGPLSGSGFLVPHSEGRLMTACSYASSKWPHWAEPDEVVLRVSAGRSGDRRAMEMSDVEVVQAMHNELVEALQLTQAPIRARVARWVDAFPQYGVGHLERVARLESALRRDLPSVQVVGAAYRGLGITTCIAQGRAAVRRALEAAEEELEPSAAHSEPGPEPVVAGRPGDGDEPVEAVLGAGTETPDQIETEDEAVVEAEHEAETAGGPQVDAEVAPATTRWPSPPAGQSGRGQAEGGGVRGTAAEKEPPRAGHGQDQTEE